MKKMDALEQHVLMAEQVVREKPYKGLVSIYGYEIDPFIYSAYGTAGMDPDIFICKNRSPDYSCPFQGVSASDRQRMYPLFSMYDDLSSTWCDRGYQR